MAGAVLVLNSGGSSCAGARAVLDDHFAELLASSDIPRPSPSSPLRRYDCHTDFHREGGMRGYTECRYIIGEGNVADDAMEIVVPPP